LHAAPTANIRDRSFHPEPLDGHCNSSELAPLPGAPVFRVGIDVAVVDDDWDCDHVLLDRPDRFEIDASARQSFVEHPLPQLRIPHPNLTLLPQYSWAGQMHRGSGAPKRDRLDSSSEIQSRPVKAFHLLKFRVVPLKHSRSNSGISIDSPVEGSESSIAPPDGLPNVPTVSGRTMNSVAGRPSNSKSRWLSSTTRSFDASAALPVTPAATAA